MWRKQKSLGLQIHFVVWKHWPKNRKMDCKRDRGSSSETGISIRIVNKSVIESNRSRKKRKFIKASMEKHKWVPREAQRDSSLPILFLDLFFFFFFPEKIHLISPSPLLNNEISNQTTLPDVISFNISKEPNCFIGGRNKYFLGLPFFSATVRS